MAKVYTHSIDGKVFYVGMGTNIRPYDFQNRPDYWKNFVNERYKDLVVEEVCEDVSKEEAFKIEADTIHKIGLDNLTNKRAYQGNPGVLVLNTETGIYYDSIAKAAKSAGMNRTTLDAYLNGWRKRNINFIKV